MLAAGLPHRMPRAAAPLLRTLVPAVRGRLPAFAAWAAMLAAVAVDARSPEAALLLARCTGDASVGFALDGPAHLAAWPWTAAAMLLMCLPLRAPRPGDGRRAMARVVLMLLAMPPACGLAALAARAAPGGAATLVYGATMLAASMAMLQAWAAIAAIRPAGRSTRAAGRSPARGSPARS